MNCKPGDMAIVISSTAGNEGKIVQCLRLASRKEIDDCNFEAGEGPVWWITPALVGRFGRLVNMGPDKRLKPIRDQDGEDETLTWAGKPQEVTA